MGSQLENQLKALKEIYSEIRKSGAKIEPIILDKFALTVYTQGMYPASNISLLYPDLELLYKVLKNLGYERLGDYWIRDDIAIEVSKKFELIPVAKFNKVDVDDFQINVISLEHLLIDMMHQCVEGDFTVCDIIKMLMKSYYNFLDFHYLYRNLKDKRFVKEFKRIKEEILKEAN
jgi:hypothetical protein